MTILVQQLFNGLTLGVVYVLLALGITLIFGLTNLVMFAQGELMMIGAYTTWFAMSHGWNYFATIPLACAVLLLIGFILERSLFRWTLRTPVNGFLASLGLIIVLQSAVDRIWGSSPVTIAYPFTQVWNVDGVLIPAQAVFVILVASAIIAILFWFLRFSPHGQALRATAENRDAAVLSGIPVGRFITLTFCIGSALAGIAGALIISLFPVTPFIGADYIIKAFAIAIVGGLGSVEGAVVVGLSLGIVEALGAGYVSVEWTDGFAFAAILIMLLVKPGGLFRGASGAVL
jgi:branched-chain amino acid transport system permease protein